MESLATCCKTVLVDGSTDCGGRILVCTLLEDLKCSILNGLYSSSRPYSLIYIYIYIDLLMITTPFLNGVCSI